MISIIPMESGLAAAVSIPQNTDLNDLTTPGAYYSLNSTTSATLSHCPVTTSGFSLLVMQKGTLPAVTQIIVYESNMYFRGRTSSSWSTWHQVTYT